MPLIDGRFRLGSQVGTGGMGVVYRARDEQLDREVAIKIVDGQSSETIQRAHREADVLAQLVHPAIVRYVSHGTTSEGRLYLVMEWVDGVTAAMHLTSRGFTLAEAVAVTRRVASALAIAHDAGILHRDLKPSNVVLPDGDPHAAILIDFGIAHARGSVVSLTRTGMTIGTPGYMAPEQARGERNLSPATDVFGLACLFYECATGRPAFIGKVPSVLLAKILVAEPTPIEELCREIPAELRALVERMLLKDAGARIADCASVCRALDSIGPIADGPRRLVRAIDETSTLPQRRRGARSHCVIMASGGSPDELLTPPSGEESIELATAVDAHRGTLEICATGMVLVHLAGNSPEVVRRAALIALEVRRILPHWSIAISSLEPDARAATDSCAGLLSEVVMTDIFATPRSASIVLEAVTAAILVGEFELEAAADRAVLKKRI